ncbi:MAG: alpha/beta hydrolase [Clostridia bacterium]|nr:alpha/beta hydrolase [Clostridia bacterium]
MRGLVLYGAKCAPAVWESVRDGLADYNLTYVEYPRKMLSEAETVDDIAGWVAGVYGAHDWDVLIGHSMGGQTALKAARLFKRQPKKVILIESNPVPSGGFYRNLMTTEHMERYGASVARMFRAKCPITLRN